MREGPASSKTVLIKDRKRHTEEQKLGDFTES
jgi:hypothetical protein